MTMCYYVPLDIAYDQYREIAGNNSNISVFRDVPPRADNIDVTDLLTECPLLPNEYLGIGRMSNNNLVFYATYVYRSELPNENSKLLIGKREFAKQHNERKKGYVLC